MARRDDDPVPVTEGEALCYVAHEDALRKIVDRNLHSALIVEDDADWDVAIRRQIGPVAEAVRLLTDEAHRDGGAAPYGDEWDLLILGHCVSRFLLYVNVLSSSFPANNTCLREKR